ncbi:glutathione S-transferase theta-3 [Anastrepha obliqua]|uniref:glutathione S-transferase theta-3 n=1 Tax=Anastrepha ludens TaxID=28586 RepID=UPI0023B03779|nr:glutathione S-transferase theta-3 [Anastrepha ludens]XP_054730834.1 glutathione S-transferase theta-3 [Anastrepha obliqua]
MQPIKFYFDFLNQSSRALYVFMEASKIPFEAIPISILKGEHLTGEFRDKVSQFKRLPVIKDENFLLAESVAIFRHLNREKIVPEHWYPRRNFGRSRVDEFLEWQQRNMGLASSNYFKQKWLLPVLDKTSPDEKNINIATERLNQCLKDFENLFLHKNKFVIGDNISYADLMAICEIDQPKFIGFNPFNHHPKLYQWYEKVRDELGPYYKHVADEFDNKIKTAEKKIPEVMYLQQ